MENIFTCSLLMDRYKMTAVQGMQLKHITRLIRRCQTNSDWQIAAPWPKTPPETSRDDWKNDAGFGSRDEAGILNTDTKHWFDGECKIRPSIMAKTNKGSVA